jgi:hypothetical protein
MLQMSEMAAASGGQRRPHPSGVANSKKVSPGAGPHPANQYQQAPMGTQVQPSSR